MKKNNRHLHFIWKYVEVLTLPTSCILQILLTWCSICDRHPHCFRILATIASISVSLLYRLYWYFPTDPNSRVNLRHWSLLTLFCSVIPPTDKCVRKYLRAHLQRCATDYVSEEGKYARYAEKVSRCCSWRMCSTKICMSLLFTRH